MAGRQQHRAVLPGEVGIGRDGELLRHLERLLEVLGQHQQRLVPGVLDESSLPLCIAQPESECGLLDEGGGAKETHHAAANSSTRSRLSA